jgi:hypothetical protein
MRKQVALALATAIVSVTAPSKAGFVADAGVFVGNGVAGGPMGSVYLNSGDVAYVGCQVTANATGSVVNCFATDASGNSASCTTSGASEVANVVQALSLVTSDASLAFNVANDGTCSMVEVAAASATQPKRTGD